MPYYQFSLLFKVLVELFQKLAGFGAAPEIADTVSCLLSALFFLVLFLLRLFGQKKRIYGF